MSKIGTLGETLVKEWLQGENYHVLGKNWRCRWGEIDIIAQGQTDQTIAFVEVKTRSKFNWDENGLLAVDATKQEKIIATAGMFLAQYPDLAEFPCRFDVALVSYVSHQGKDIKDIKNTPRAIALGVPMKIEQYQLILENYLQSAFEA